MALAPQALERKKALTAARRKLQDGGINLALLEARVLLCHACGLTHEELLISDDVVLSPAEQARLDQLLERRLEGEPIAYLIGRKEFFGLEFLVDEATLIPRPDTEVLVEKAVDFSKALGGEVRVLDLGIGSGAILLSILSALPSALGVGIDRSPGAARMAQENARRLGLAKRAFVLCGDWAEALGGTFDVIVTNPPYIRTSDFAGLDRDVRAYEPESALIGGSDGLDPLRVLAPQIKRLIAPQGLVLVETGFDQTAEAADILRNVGLRPDKPVPDLNGLPRCVAARP